MATAVVIPSAEWHKEEIKKATPQAEYGLRVRAEAESTSVTDDWSRDEAVALLQTIATKKAEVADWWKPLTDAAHKAHKELTAKRGEMLAPLEHAEMCLKGKISTYLLEQQRIAREAAQAAEEQARREAEEARERDLERMERERRSVAEVAAVANAPLPYIAPSVSVLPPSRPQGMSMRSQWKARVTNKAALIAYTVANPAWQHLVLPDEGALNDIAKRQKSAASIPGVEFYESQTVSVRR